MKTIEEILEMMRIEMPFHLPERIKPYISEAMQVYAKQQQEIAVEKALQMAADKAEIYDANEGKCGGMLMPCFFVDSTSILSLVPQILEELKGGEGE